MDVRQTLQQLPDSDPASVDRVWQRFRASREAERQAPAGWWSPGLVLGGGGGIGLGLAVAAAALWMVSPSFDRRELLSVDDGMAEVAAWSDEVSLTIEGNGEIVGTDKKAEIEWRSGTITASVAPNSGNQLSIVTEEARIDVVGTVFSVTRDRLGVTTSVERGKVNVTCEDGWSGLVEAGDPARTCLPVRPALLLGRADALEEANAGTAARLGTLNAGLAVAERGSGIAGELLARRMRVHGDAGDIEAMLADADAYLTGEQGRAVDVRRYAAWTVMASPGGCTDALRFLSELEHTGNAQDRVLLAQCVLSEQPQRARTLLEDAIPQLDDTWTLRARTLLERLP